MAIDPVWFVTQQITRIVESMGWKVISTDTAGPTIKILIEKEKPEKL